MGSSCCSNWPICPISVLSAVATTTALALTALLIFGGDVIRGFVFAMLFGVIIGTYSTLYVAKNIVLMLGVDRGDKPKKERAWGEHEFANIDA